jgi:hypothetical protein
MENELEMTPQLMETTEQALGISPDRHRKLTWIVEEICAEGGTKSEGMQKIAKTDTTDIEKVYMGFILCKKYVSLLPWPMRNIAMGLIQ